MPKARYRQVSVVELNPIRAGMAMIPEQSDYTSIQERISQPDNDSLLALDGEADDVISISLKSHAFANRLCPERA